MKKFLIASGASAALALAAPAFAQISSGETVQGTVTTPSVTAPVTQATEAGQAAAAPQSGTGEAAAEIVSPTTTPDTTAAATITTPDARPTINAAAETTENAAEAGGATASGEAEASAYAPTLTVQGDASANAAASSDLPQPVQLAVADGRYTSDDLNRAQLEALGGAPGR
ncbi:hypothetical protein [Candidatus Viadribacter manganicus]|uniref:Uncharacterized protein n=1 Tax=Candidatus Viadribacter manganicus TaxID=1759059 RepID=A0A1B1ADA9_9PROT|nr:hypothetical protein [Candidatus Viadribacter manganicus]ANP44539.1 hypothetical protein ATE48_00670 [Candidatus Viadribacter manganicus]